MDFKSKEIDTRIGGENQEKKDKEKIRKRKIYNTIHVLQTLVY